jgi:TusA-related sulfurtransferase
MRCPQPVIELARHLGDLDVGERLAVAATDPAAGPDIRAWCRMKGQEFVGQDLATDGTPRYIVRRLG